MSEENKIGTEQEALIRESLVRSVFEQYHKLIQTVKKLPLPASLPGLQKAYLDIDTGLLWIKELLLTAPLVLIKPEKKEESAPEENPSNEPSVPCENTTAENDAA